MIEQIRNMLRRVSSTSPQVQRQREAMLDLLVWTMYADRAIKLPERDLIDTLADEMTWDSPTAFGQYLDTAITRVRDALSSEEKSRALLDDISARLASQEMRERAYEACWDLARADGDVATKETQFLATVKDRFGIT